MMKHVVHVVEIRIKHISDLIFEEIWFPIFNALRNRDFFMSQAQGA